MLSEEALKFTRWRMLLFQEEQELLFLCDELSALELKVFSGKLNS